MTDARAWSEPAYDPGREATMTTTQRPARGAQPPATRAEVRQALGALADDVLDRILALGPTLGDLRVARERIDRPPADWSRSGSDTERIVEAVRDAIAQGED